VSAACVAALEEVLAGYAEPYDPSRPQVNFDETTKQLLKETRLPLPAQPGQPPRYDDAYERNGTRNRLLFVEPQAGWRHVNVPAQRTKLNFAHQRQGLVDERYPEAEVGRVTLDKLNTHKPAALYEAFPPAEARRIARKLEFHYTPKHGRWLHMAEIELRVLQQQCLDRRIPDEETRKGEMAAWEAQRNAEQATMDWRFSVTEAREKLNRLYPSLSS
jgi:hypothetical protein